MSALSLELLRPWALAGVMLPLILHWLARRPARPWPSATGTFAIWCALAAERPVAATGTRPRIPLAVWCLAAALALASLALCGPRPMRCSAPRNSGARKR